jgi:hypothetical protein
MQETMTIESAINQAILAAFDGEKIKGLVTEAVEKAVASEIKSSLSYGDLSKAIQQAIDGILPEGKLDADLTAYHAILARMLREKLEAVASKGFEKIVWPELEEYFKEPPKVVKLSEIVEAWKKDCTKYEDERDFEGTGVEVDVKYDEYRTPPRFAWVTLKGHSALGILTSREEMRFGLISTNTEGDEEAVTEEGYRVFQCRQSKRGRMPIQICAETERLIFAAWAGKAEIVLDEDDCDLDYACSDY